MPPASMMALLAPEARAWCVIRKRSSKRVAGVKRPEEVALVARRHAVKSAKCRRSSRMSRPHLSPANGETGPASEVLADRRANNGDGRALNNKIIYQAWSIFENGLSKQKVQKCLQYLRGMRASCPERNWHSVKKYQLTRAFLRWLFRSWPSPL